MDQLATIPIWIWSLWMLGAVLLVWGFLVLGETNKRVLNRKTGSISLLHRALLLLVGGFLSGSYGFILYTFHLDEERVKKAIKQDPALSRMASIAEALDWMEEEVEPLVLELDSADERLKRAERQREAAIAEIEKINVQLGEKEREFERRFGHLAPPVELPEGHSSSPLMIDPNAVYRAGRK